MVQVLPYVPSFGEKLASSFGKAAGQIGKSYLQNMEKEKSRSVIQQFQDQLAQQESSDLGTPMDQVNSAASQSVKQLKPIDIAQVYKAYENVYGPEAAALKGKEFQENQVSSRKRREEIQDRQLKKQEEDLKEQKENEGIRDSIDFLEKNIEYTGSRIIPGTKSTGASFYSPDPKHREAAQVRAEFDSTGTQLADLAYSRVNKGTQSKEKINLWKKEWAPNSNLPERENIARINSLKRFMNLPEKTSNQEIKKIEAQEKRNIKEASKVVNVYDSAGALVGTVDKDQESQLPEGYVAR